MSIKTQDEIIVALGEELELLSREYGRLEDICSHSKDRDVKSSALHAYDLTYEKMLDVCTALSVFKATTLEAAAVQMRVLSYYSTSERNDTGRKLNALIFSVVGALENEGNFSRNQWAGEFYLGSQDPFERVEAKAPQKQSGTR